ncbi:hypothetical protein ACP4OV_031041 [Aristida adscensionis]
MENTSDVQIAHCSGDSETTIGIKIKTLDSQTYNLRVNKCVPIPLLKEKIATVTGILSEQQRLICRGRVLKDDELLSAYHVEDGHTLHLVVRQPGQSVASGNAGAEELTRLFFSANTSNSGQHRGRRSIVVETLNMEHGSSELPPGLAQILQSLFGMPITHESGAPAPSDSRHSEPTQSSIPNTVRVEVDHQQAPLLFQSEPVHGSSQPNVIPDALTTISQYIDFMRDSFSREGINQNGQTEGNGEHQTVGGGTVGGTPNYENQTGSASTHGLPTAALLAETMNSTRQIIVEQAGTLLSQLSAQLGGLVNVTDSAARRSLQSRAMRSGVLLQNLGSLLLELGRSTMMLHINPSSSEAVVNSGPAVFISSSGPNPLMVQEEGLSKWVQYFLALAHKDLFHTPEMSTFISIQGGSAPVASTDPSELAGAQQTQQHTNRTGDASHVNIGEAFSGVAGGSPFSVESGVRLLPLRTVLATGISRPPSGSSSGVGIIYPLLSRIQQRANANGRDQRNGQSPSEPARNAPPPDQQSIPRSSQVHEEGNLGSASAGNNSETSPGQGLFPQLLDRLQWIGSLLSGENGRANGTSQQAPLATGEQVDATNHGTPEVSVVSEEGLRFANLVRQIMPFISQAETQHPSVPPVGSSIPVQDASGSSNRGTSDSRSSHQHNQDQIDEPNSKRQSSYSP